MKKLNKWLKKGLSLTLASLMAFGAVACTDGGDSTGSTGSSDSSDTASDTLSDTTSDSGDDLPIEAVEISVTAEKDTIKKGEEVALTVTVSNATDKGYTWSVSKDGIVKIQNDVLSVVADVKVDTIVTITATSKEDPTKSASKTFTVKAPVIEGQVGELTSDMLEELGNASITVDGVLTDYYQDFNSSFNNSTQIYDMKVTMEEGAWSGSWNARNSANVISDTYIKGDEDGLKDQYGNEGHALERVYIDKNNQLASAVEKDYISMPAIWEAQHLWNHIGNLQITKFTYDAENEVYKYNADLTKEEDAYLMTYLSYSLTPLLSDTLAEVYFKIEDGAITKMIAQTETLYYGEYVDQSTNETKYDALSYSTVELTFSEVGTTKVAMPQPYAAPQYVDKLQKAIETMASAKNYTFHTVDVQTYAPSGDSSDYEIEATSTGTVTRSVSNNVSSEGTVGCYGQITETAALFATTGKYSYTMDGKNYHTSYSGLKQNGDGTYDQFEYKNDALTGTKKVKGNIFDALPSFDFSPNIFRFSALSVQNGKNVYKFILNETAIMRDLAMEVCAYSYADDAAASATENFSIVVDEDGNLISTTFPYDLVSGTYMGYCTTTYSNVGTTVLEDTLFDNYVPRITITGWGDFTTKYYTPTFSTLDSHEENTEVVIAATYGDAADEIPSPTLFMDIFGDNISGPFYDYKQKGTDADGNPVYTGWLGFTTTSSEYDENGQITNFEEIIEQLTTALTAEGFTLSPANTDTTGGASGRSNRYVTFVKEDIMIVIENNFTKYFWIDFYKAGDWTLNR
ncbi:MAG: hypothetical protein IJX91_04755 [Clostridia bacterium]|nr:hypothetical protein [Clostridia bacterium]